MVRAIFLCLGALLLVKDVVLVSLYGRALAARVGRRWRPWAWAAAALFGTAVALPVVVVFGRLRGIPAPPGGVATVYFYALYVWHLGGLAAFAGLSALAAGRALARLARRRGREARAGALAPGALAPTGDGAASATSDPEPVSAQVTEPRPTPSAGPRAEASRGASPDAGLTRRDLLARAALAAPPFLLAGATGAAWWRRGRFVVREQVVVIADLPTGLDGMTIAHVSDLHIGRLIVAELLEPVVEAVGRLGCDLVVLTGDTVDRSNAYLPACIDALGRMRAPLGVYACMGNHDAIDDGRAFARALRGADLHGQGPRTLLVNESIVLERGGAAFALGGIDFARRDAESRAYVERAFAGAPPDLPRLLLSHHPHAFDAAAPAGVALTLSGHTHGGQFVLFRGDEEAVLDSGAIARSGETLTPGRLLFRYLEGLYERDGRFLFVSRGAGDWLPIRMNCAPEVTRLTLRRAAPNGAAAGQRTS